MGKYVLDAGESGASSRLGADLDAPATAGLDDAMASKALIRDWTPPDASGDIVGADCEADVLFVARMVVGARRERDGREDEQQQCAQNSARPDSEQLGLGSALGLWSQQTPAGSRRIQPPPTSHNSLSTAIQGTNLHTVWALSSIAHASTGCLCTQQDSKSAM